MTNPDLVTLAAICDAAARIAPYVRWTPVVALSLGLDPNNAVAVLSGGNVELGFSASIAGG